MTFPEAWRFLKLELVTVEPLEQRESTEDTGSDDERMIEFEAEA